MFLGRCRRVASPEPSPQPSLQPSPELMSQLRQIAPHAETDSENYTP